MATAADPQTANKWDEEKAKQSPLVQTYGWTPEEVQQLGQRGIGPVSLGQMNLESPNALQMLRAMISQPSAAPAQTAATTQAATRPSYYGASPQISMGTGTSGTSSSGGGNTMANTTTASQIPTGVWGQAGPADIQEWQKWYGANLGKTIMVNGQPTTIGAGNAGNIWNAFRSNQVGFGPSRGAQISTGASGGSTTPSGKPLSGVWGSLTPAEQSQIVNQMQAGARSFTVGGQQYGVYGGDAAVRNYVNAGPTPEKVALSQMAQTDPTSEALRQSLGKSYLSQLQGGAAAPQFGLDLSKGAAAPSTADVQSYLNLYKQIDPSGFAQRAGLAGQYGSYLQQLQSQAALGAQLDPGTIREVTQGARAAQAARGNVYGTPQLVAETMARGQAGEQRLLQRQQALGQGLGAMQGYLTSGAGLGDVANNLYNQGYSRYLQGQGQALNTWQAQQNAIAQRQQSALGYLGSGQTPYQAGSNYLQLAQQNAANAAQGGPQYNPQALGPQYSGTAQQFPQYGLDMSQLAGNWYNNINTANLQAYGYQQAYGQRGGGGSLMGAGAGALGGAASGALAGAAAGGIGAIPGAIIGGIGGAASGYFK